MTSEKLEVKTTKIDCSCRKHVFCYAKLYWDLMPFIVRALSTEIYNSNTSFFTLKTVKTKFTTKPNYEIT